MKRSGEQALVARAQVVPSSLKTTTTPAACT